MSHEGLVAPAANQQESLLYEDGSVNEALLEERFGLSAADAQQEVTFGSYSGSVAQMLDDERCPVGDMVATAYKEKGIDGVAEQFKNLSAMDPNFSAVVSPVTLEREELKKK